MNGMRRNRRRERRERLDEQDAVEGQRTEERLDQREKA